MKHPEYDRSRFKVWALPHPLILHWVLNPGVAFNELVLGQRIPKVSLIDKFSDRPLIERTYVPCPHCKSLHDGRLWGKGNAFGHWFGYVCPTCANVIPCQWNVLSLLVLAATFPLWYLPVKFLRPKWLAYEKLRMNRRFDQPLEESKDINWLLRGTFIFGGIIWIVMSLVPEFVRLQSEGDFSWAAVGKQLLVWLAAGFIWGAAMKFWMGRKGNKSNKAPQTAVTGVTRSGDA